MKSVRYQSANGVSEAEIMVTNYRAGSGLFRFYLYILTLTPINKAPTFDVYFFSSYNHLS
jgi:hypothetical protein